MDKAIIFGTYEFLSFALCKRLLDDGLDVVGVHLDTDHSFTVMEEKRLEVGRNANFIEKSFHDLSLLPTCLQKSVLVISVYDYYVNQFDEQAIEVLQYMQKLIKNDCSKQLSLNIMIFMPIKLLVFREEKMNVKVNTLLNCLQLHCKERAHKLQIFYVPTIYGPWQPDSFLFHQVLKNRITLKEETHDLGLSDREYTEDAIYIDDLIEKTINLNETEGSAVFLLKSETENHWNKCAETVMSDVNFIKSEKRSDGNNISVDEMIVKLVKETTPLIEGLEIQKNQMSRLLNGIINT